MRRMVVEQEDVFYYVTVMNENYVQPPMPEGAQEGILRGLYPVREAEGERERVQLFGSGTILREALAAADLLRDDFQIEADVWSVTSWSELRRQASQVERWNLLHPTEPQRLSYLEERLESRPGPVIAASDWVRAVPEQIRPFVPARYRTLGTDGFGRSDGRERLRHHFEVNRFFIAVAALKALSDDGRLPPAAVKQAIEKYGIDPDKPDPVRS
jgi:pyruvate dehydrogenase E1 component